MSEGKSLLSVFLAAPVYGWIVVPIWVLHGHISFWLPCEGCVDRQYCVMYFFFVSGHCFGCVQRRCIMDPGSVVSVSGTNHLKVTHHLSWVTVSGDADSSSHEKLFTNCVNRIVMVSLELAWPQVASFCWVYHASGTCRTVSIGDKKV